MEAPNESIRRKHELRREAHARRQQQEDRDQLSRDIFRRLSALREYVDAATLMLYVSFHSEVDTRAFLSTVWFEGKRIVVPYCVGDRLQLFRLNSMDELSPGTLGILEPRAELRSDADRQVPAAEIDMVVAPGLAFDRQCGRIGYGKGYYDRFLHEARPDAAVVGVAFQCQIFPEIPVTRHDVRMDKVITERAMYERTLPRFESQ